MKNQITTTKNKITKQHILFGVFLVALLSCGYFLADRIGHEPEVIYREYPNERQKEELQRMEDKLTYCEVENSHILGTSNRIDCQNRGGEYSLSIKSNGEVYYEWCQVSEWIDYAE